MLPALVPLLKPGGDLLMLVKPQFELQPGQVGKRGIVHDPSLYAVVEQRLRDCCASLGLQVRGWFDSPIAGGDGNREFFVSRNQTTRRHSMNLPISLEFFPPKTPEGAAKLRVARQSLYELKPEFCSVTYGAGGSTQEGTFSTVSEILAEGVDAAAHFSCVGATHDKVRQELAQLRAMGVKRLVALRGDLPSGYGMGGEFHYASDLVAFIRAETGNEFRIEVACYPEIHPAGPFGRGRPASLSRPRFVPAPIRRSRSTSTTPMPISASSRKRIGWAFMCRWCPGIMPITNSTQLMRFSDACGAEIPRWIRLRLQGFGDDSASIKSFGLDVVTALCEQLRAGGAPGIHFYTMNQAAATVEICKRLGW